MLIVYCFLFSDSVTLLSSAVDFIRNFQPTKQLMPSSGKLKREISMEEIFQVIKTWRVLLESQRYKITSFHIKECSNSK